jgi:hypothetical protein
MDGPFPEWGGSGRMGLAKYNAAEKG